jgi:hypothetical protein
VQSSSFGEVVAFEKRLTFAQNKKITNVKFTTVCLNIAKTLLHKTSLLPKLQNAYHNNHKCIWQTWATCKVFIANKN